MSTYRSFSQLADHEEEGTDYRIRCRLGTTGIGVVAIHGGGIEPGTTEIAETVAGCRHSLYTFSGIKRRGNAALHITSHLFDEPQINDLVARTAIIFSIHGCRDAEPIVFTGGRHHRLAERMGKMLESAGFRTAKSVRCPGLNTLNICNRGCLAMGVQLEISAGLRRHFFGDLKRQPLQVESPLVDRFVKTVAAAVGNMDAK